MDILDIIVHHKVKEVKAQEARVPLIRLKDSIFYDSDTVSLSKYLKREDKSGVIAEFKRKSPSKPEINLFAQPEEITVGYMRAGASALSVLTDSHFFGGSNYDLSVARKFNYCPILRKDFIINLYQIHEAKSIGADAILLIAEILTADQVREFTSLAQDLGLEVLLELHSADQLSKISSSVNIVGVNNRNLKTFKTNIQSSIDMVEMLPDDRCIISESGIHNVDQMISLSEAGYDGFLIGERFMAQSDPVLACQELLRDYHSKRKLEICS